MGRDGRGVKSASSSSIEITFTFEGERCREKIKLKPTPANLKRAEQHRAAILHAIETGTFDYASTFPESSRAKKFAKQEGDIKTFADYLPAWLTRQKPLLKSSTFDGYRKIVNGQLVPWFGKFNLSELKKKDVRDTLSPLDVTNKRLSNIQSVLRKSLDDAIEDELIDINPLANWCYKKVEPRKSSQVIDPFTKEEQAAILKAVTDPQLKNQIAFSFWTGVRPSELIALEWGDVDFVRGVVRIDKAMTATAEEAEGTKTLSGNREIKLLRPALDAITKQKAHTFMKSGLVFLNPTSNQQWTGDQQLRKNIWIPLLKKAGVRYRNPYQTRHTFASMMLSAGEHPMWVAKQMGHSDWTMIAKVYGKWMPDANINAGDKAVSIFAATKVA